MNSCYHGEPATWGLQSIYPKAEPEEIKIPDIAGEKTLPLSEKQKFLAPHKLTKEAFKIEKKVRSKDKKKSIFITPEKSFDHIYINCPNTQVRLDGLSRSESEGKDVY